MNDTLAVIANRTVRNPFCRDARERESAGIAGINEEVRVLGLYACGYVNGGGGGI